MRVILSLLGLLFGTAALLLATGQPANAGTFTMKQCEGSFQHDFQATYASINGGNEVDVVNGCTTTGAGKIGIYQDRNGTDLEFGEGGQFRWDTPAGERVLASAITARLKNANSIEAELIGFDGTSVTDLDGGVEHDGEKRLSTWSDPGHPQTLIAARLLCRSLSKCANRSTSAKAFMEVTDTEFTVEDYSAPTVAAADELWSWAGDSQYHHGISKLSVGGTDQGAGIAAAWAEVNGLRVDFTAPSCPGDKGSYSSRFDPCPSNYLASRNFDTSVAPFQEGPNLIRVCLRDYAAAEAGASRSCTETRTVLIDNKAPNPPVNLRSDQGAGWQPENGFTLRWETPSGQIAPIAGAAYVLWNLETGNQVGFEYVTTPGVVSLGPVDVPEVGAYRADIYLVDAAANIGEPASTTLRFDDRPPGNVSPEPADGWISKDELPIDQEVEKAVAGGPSGVSGYAIRVSEQSPASPCGSGVCLAPEITLAGGIDQRTGSIDGLAEGDHWISSVAVSGARRSSLEPGSTLVQVDRTVPSSNISGVPNEWVDHPVTLTVEAADRLSGMQPEPGDDGEPATVIDADNYATYRSPGAIATFAVATEGVNRIRYWAEDLAGNANDGLPGTGGDVHPAPGQAVVRIDMTPPDVRFESNPDPEDPELVRVSVSDADSGVSSAEISIRAAGTGSSFTPLTTTSQGGSFEARIPSDDLPRGAYELIVEASDRAGNVTTGSRNAEGEPMILTLPLKQPAELTASIGSGLGTTYAKYGSPEFIEGRLTSEGKALPNQAIRIVETFVAGSKMGEATRTIRTDGDGRYRMPVSTGPSRAVSASFDGTPTISRARSTELVVKVKGRVRLRIKPRKILNGGVVRMRGSVGFSGALPPARGKLVAIQYLDPSRHKWRPVEVLRTNRTGRFRYTYRFRTITSAQRIVFRANALPEAGWPYLPSTSKPRSVIVYPKK